MKRKHLGNNLMRRLSIGVLVMSGAVQLGGMWVHHQKTKRK
jgi:hypothetical protein